MKSYMNIRKIFSSVFLVLALLVIPYQNVFAQFITNVTTPATGCQPANLQQALALGLGWSQFGVTNNSSIGGGSFFIACPVIVDDVTSGDNILVNAVFLASNATDITCTIYVVETFNNGGPPVVVGTQMLTFNNPGTGNNVGVFTSGPLPGGPVSDTAGINLICAMHPQTRIGDIHLFTGGP